MPYSDDDDEFYPTSSHYKPEYSSADGAMSSDLNSRKDMEINNLNSKLEDEQNLVAQLQKKIKELQVRTIHYKFNYYIICTDVNLYFLLRIITIKGLEFRMIDINSVSLL